MAMSLVSGEGPLPGIGLEERFLRAIEEHEDLERWAFFGDFCVFI